jgi:hypothetical protein
MAEQTGIWVSHITVRAYLKAPGTVLSRPQHKITSPDPAYEIKKRTVASVQSRGYSVRTSRVL